MVEVENDTNYNTNYKILLPSVDLHGLKKTS